MIKTPTVLVLGAGASQHVGYPLGDELISNLCRVGAETHWVYPNGLTCDDAIHFLNRLSRAGHNSVDAFLETVPNQVDLGKYLMARQIKNLEDIDKLFPPNNSGWYHYLFNSLLEDNSASGFASSRLSIITFNYDRSLEAYLHAALMARFDMPSAEATSTVSKIPIVHVHGSLGAYPDTPYTPQCTDDELLEISKQIQIVYEMSDSNDRFCNTEFQRANALLNESKRIFFLGFGFHPDNIRRFRFFSADQTVGREIHATTRGMGPIALKDLVLRLEPLGIEETDLNGHPCNRFFTHVAELH